MLKAACLYRLKQHGPAAQHYRACLEDQQIAAARHVRALYALGNCLVQQGTGQAAILEEEYPNDPSIRYAHIKDDGALEALVALRRTPYLLSSTLPDYTDEQSFLTLPMSEGEAYTSVKVKDAPVYLILFRYQAFQGLAFDRVAVFVEGEPGNLPSDADLWFWNFAHHVTGGGWGRVDYRRVTSMAGVIGFTY